MFSSFPADFAARAWDEVVWVDVLLLFAHLPPAFDEFGYPSLHRGWS
jgi:hypothetical protein